MLGDEPVGFPGFGEVAVRAAEHDDIVAGLTQRTVDVAAEEAAAPRHEDAHQMSAGLRVRYQAIVCSSPSSSSTTGSQPSTLRAFSTFGMRSSTSA